MASLAVNLAYSNSKWRMLVECKGFTWVCISGGGGDGKGFELDLRFRAKISLIARILTIKNPKEITTLLKLNIIVLSGKHYQESS
jgi:hypothetical protein